MKKRLLMMAFAVLSVASSFAYEVGEYAYNSTQRFKITGENLVTNGNFANGLDGWFGATIDAAPNAEVWSVEEGAGENGENAIKSLGATADEPLCGVWDVNVGTYIVSIDVKFPSATNTGVSSATAVDANCIDFFLNSDGAFKKIESTEELPVIGVAASTYCSGEEWKKLVFFFTASEGQKLVMHIEKLATEAQISNVEIHEAVEVYDIRVAEKRIAYAKQLMALPEFDTANAQEAKEELSGAIEAIEGMIESGVRDMEDPSSAPGIMGEMEEYFVKFLDASSTNLKKDNFFKYVEDLTSFPKYNRGSIKNEQVIGGFKFRGDNWLHGQGASELAKQIQTSFVNPAGSVSLYDETLPAGKYFISAEVRNSYCDKNYKLTYTLEKDVKVYVGKDSMDCGNIKGDEWVRFSYIGELKDGEIFDAGFWWEGLDTKEGARFEIRDFEIRAMVEDVEAKAAHIKAWNTFKEQWDAASNRIKQFESMIGNKDYPWAQDSLVNANSQWYPYYEEIVKKGWVAADGSDAGVATTDELNEWAAHQGYYPADTTETSSDAEKAWYKNYSQYAVVRGYDYAIKYVIAQNKPISDLKAAIADAIATRDDDMNINGNKTTFQKAIDAAQSVYDEIYANTTDARREADETTIASQMNALAEAKVAFEESAKLTPIVDIDFSNKAVEGDEVAYVIQGATGQMEFGSFETDNSVSGSTNFQQGIGEELLDVLRVGNGSATVKLNDADIPSDEDVIRVNFDLWVGGLIGKNVYVDLQNADGERVAGFSYDLYDGTTAYNDFDNDAHEGLNIAACGKGTAKNENAVLHGDTYKFSFDLIVDFKAQTVQALLPASPTGAKNGGLIALKDMTNNKIAKFVLGSNYNNSNRRCWFDNLKIYKYASQAEGPHQFVTLGDVNGDKAIDVADVVGIVNKILGEPNADFIEAAADVNGDGKIDVADVVATVNIILGE